MWIKDDRLVTYPVTILIQIARHTITRPASHCHMHIIFICILVNSHEYHSIFLEEDMYKAMFTVDFDEYVFIVFDSGPEAQKLWNRIKSYYMQRLRIHAPSGSPAPEDLCKLGPYGNLLQFLQPVTKRGKSVNTSAYICINFEYCQHFCSMGQFRHPL